MTFRGELPDLFREGQGVVAMGAFDDAGVFVARSPESSPSTTSSYMPPQVAAALKKEGEWRRGPSSADHRGGRCP